MDIRTAITPILRRPIMNPLKQSTMRYFTFTSCASNNCNMFIECRSKWKWCQFCCGQRRLAGILVRDGISGVKTFKRFSATFFVFGRYALPRCPAKIRALCYKKPRDSSRSNSGTVIAVDSVFVFDKKVHAFFTLITPANAALK
ncbi:hypothetical protein J6590_018488 [Homalodisca vitripennis]|nr:hypothetical protein J6590_018488 [Homalodisca vitripennis]